jgi:hypothetical protein
MRSKAILSNCGFALACSVYLLACGRDQNRGHSTEMRNNDRIFNKAFYWVTSACHLFPQQVMDSKLLGRESLLEDFVKTLPPFPAYLEEPDPPVRDNWGNKLSIRIVAETNQSTPFLSVTLWSNGPNGINNHASSDDDVRGPYTIHPVKDSSKH